MAGLPSWLHLARPVPGHGPVPGTLLPDLRDGGAARGPQSRARAGRPGVPPAPDTGRGERGRRPAGARAVGEQPREPGRRPGRPGERRRPGAGRGAYWSPATNVTPSSPGTGRPGPSSGRAAGPRASTACWPSIPSPSGATWRACASDGTPATPRWCGSSVRSASTPVSWSPGRRNGPAPPLWPTRPTPTPSGSRYRERLARLRQILALAGRGGAVPRRRHIPVGAGPGRGRLGSGGPVGGRGWAHRVAGRVLRAGRGRVREGGGCGPHASASSSSPPGSAGSVGPQRPRPG